MSAPPEDADVETASDGYARRFDSAAGRYMLARQMDATLMMLEGLDGASIVDVGGGHGQTAPALANREHAMTVLASAPEAVSASLRPHLDRGAIRLVTGPLREPPLVAEGFDVAMSYRLLAHANDLEGLIAALTRLAKRAVIVDYATTRSFNAVADMMFAAKKGIEKNTRPFLVLRDADVARLFAVYGFRPKGRVPQFFWPMALHRALDAPALSRALEAGAAAFGLRALFGSPVIARFDRV